MYPGVSVSGVNVSGLSRQQAYGKLQTLPLSRNYVVKVGDKVYRSSNQALGASYNLDRTIDLAYAIGRQEGLPIIGVMRSAKLGQLRLAYSIDFQKLQKFTNDIVRDVGTPPQNAMVSVENGVIKTATDEPGIGVNRAELTQLLSDSLAHASDATFVIKPTSVPADIKLSQTEPAKQSVSTFLASKYTFSYQDRNFAATPGNIGYWIVVKPDREINASQLVVQVNEQEVRGYVQTLANEINKNPVNKKVIVANGKSSVEREGQDGSALNQEAVVAQLMAALQANRDVNVVLTTSPVAFKTETTRTISLDAQKYIEVNLSKQQLWAYENGQVVHTSPITSGATGANLGTATGLFAIYYKATNTYLNGRSYGYDYNVFVKYWMPFYLGYGLHDASWRGSFGGQDYFYGGSHGCVNLPEATAAFIYNWSEIGTPVWVHV